MPDGLRLCAHQLAGAAGVFDFPAVSAAASALEETIIKRVAGKCEPGAVKIRLEALLECIWRASARRPAAAPRPLTRDSRDTSAGKPAPVAATPSRQAAPNMLIADDDPAILRLLVDRCRKMGFQVETAANGMQLLIKARHSHPDILIVDVNMPELDGLAVCTRFLDPGHKPVEVVVITGGTDPETAERCDSLGLFYSRKGPDFWKDVEAALAEIYPDLAGKIEGLELPPGHGKVPELPRVLVVDDDPNVERYLASRLAKCGVYMLFAPDARHAFNIARRERPSVILCDCFMPDGDAQYLLHRLRSKLETENIPVIVMSGKIIDELTEQSLKREICGHPGAAEIVKKAFDTDELFVALQKFCGFDRNRV